jgi:hypothetical protein
LINHGKLCLSLAAIGSSPVNHCEDWYQSVIADVQSPLRQWGGRSKS